MTYDPAGNMTNSGTFAYNADGRLTSDGTYSLSYDGSGNMVEQKNLSSGVTQDYVFQGTHEITSVDGNGVWSRGEVYAPGGHVNTYANGDTIFAHDDQIGTTRVRTDHSGAIVQHCENEPFCTYFLWCGGVWESDVLYTGQLGLDDGMIVFPARSFHSQSGRFMVPDPAGMAAVNPSNPQTWNRYAYVTNNPVSFVDPMGLNRQGPGGCNDGEGLCPDEGGGESPINNSGGGFCDASGNCGGISSPTCDASGNCTSTIVAETGADPNGVRNNFGPGYLTGTNSTLAWVQASQADYLTQVDQAFANAYNTGSSDDDNCDQSSGTDPVAHLARLMHGGFRASRRGQGSSSSNGENSCHTKPPKHPSPYLVAGTQCSMGCHPEQFKPGPDPNLCKNMGILAFVVGTAAAPSASPELGWFAWGYGTTTGAYGLFNCL